MTQQDAGVRAQLRQAGLRVTGPRQAVLGWLETHPHATVEQIAQGVAAEWGFVARQTVYNILEASVRSGLVRWLAPAGSPARYERRVDGEEHHHLVCRECGRIADVAGVSGSCPSGVPAEPDGFALGETEVVLWGYCPACAPGPES